MSHSSFSASAAYILLFCVATIVQGQTTTRLPPAAAYADGSFTSPNNAATQILDDGINLNITWSTSFPSVNLYLITGDDYGNSQALTMGTTDLFYLWKVDDNGNNSLPFLFRIANAQGSVDEQAEGGFISGAFWIRDDTAATPLSTSTSWTTTPTNIVPTTTTSPSSTTTATTTATTAMTSQTTSLTSRTTSSIMAPTTAATITTQDASTGSTKSLSGPSSEPSSRYSTASTSDSSQSSSGPPVLPTNTSAVSPTNMQIPSSPSTGTIAGIVVGAVALLAIVIGASLFFRRQRRPSLSSRHLDLVETQMAQKGYSGAIKPGYTLRDPSWESSVQKRPAELQENELVELPNYRSSRPHELQ